MLATPLSPADSSINNRHRPPERTLYSVSLPADDIPDQRLSEPHRRVLNYWRAKRGPQGTVRRTDIDPCDLGSVLPNIALWEIDGVPDYRCRLAGTEVCANLGNLQGILLGDLHCPLLDEARREFDAVRDDGLATFAERTLSWLDRPLMSYHHLLLPLVDKTGRCHQLLSVLTFHRARSV